MPGSTEAEARQCFIYPLILISLSSPDVDLLNLICWSQNVVDDLLRTIDLNLFLILILSHNQKIEKNMCVLKCSLGKFQCFTPMFCFFS